MVQKASTPWSTRTVAEGGTDSPVGDLVPIPDKITPVVNTGFISLAGKYRGIPSDDLQFTFQDPSQALGPGADIEFAVNMLQHDVIILALLDTAGNDISVTIKTGLPTTLTDPYTPFAEVGVYGGSQWLLNKATGSGTLEKVVDHTLTIGVSTWQFFKMFQLRGTQIRLVIHNNDGTDAGTISTAYLRLV